MIKTSKIIELPIDDETRRIAYSEADREAGSKILANELKYIGQEVIKKWMKDNDVELNSFKVITKQLFFTPKSSWHCYLPKECNSDFLIFVGIHEFWETSWILGYMKKEEFIDTESIIKIVNLHDIKDLIK